MIIAEQIEFKILKITGKSVFFYIKNIKIKILKYNLKQ